MDYRRLQELFGEFAEYIESLHTLYLDSVAGFSILYERLLSHQRDMKKLLGNRKTATEEFQDTCLILYKDLCNKDFTPIARTPVMKQGDIKLRNMENGRNYFLLGNHCVVSAYSYWEEYLRIEIGKAIGVLKLDAENCEKTRKILNQHVVHDFWGDMRHLRNSIIHNNGVANSDVAKCKILRWFKPGDPIELNHKKMRAIFLTMGTYRNKIYKMSSPPSQGITIK